MHKNSWENWFTLRQTVEMIYLTRISWFEYCQINKHDNDHGMSVMYRHASTTFRQWCTQLFDVCIYWVHYYLKAILGFCFAHCTKHLTIVFVITNYSICNSAILLIRLEVLMPVLSEGTSYASQNPQLVIIHWQAFQFTIISKWSKRETYQ